MQENVNEPFFSPKKAEPCCRGRVHRESLGPGVGKNALGRIVRGVEPGSEAEAIRALWRRIGAPVTAQREIGDGVSIRRHAVYRRNIENYVGTAKVPVGIVGPLIVNGQFARGEHMIPLATTEAALIASYNRGARLLTHAGGCRVRILDQGVSRAPGFVSPRCRMRSSLPDGSNPRRRPSGR